MYGDAPLTLHEFLVREEHPIAQVQDAVFSFLRGRKDMVVFGAQAVNAYVREQRLTEDVDVLAVDPEGLASALCEHLANTFRIAVRVRKLPKHQAYRIYQIKKPENRHLVDIRGVEALPPFREVHGLLVVAPEYLVAQKILAYASRRGQLKSWTDRRDIGATLVQFPELRDNPSIVRSILQDQNAPDATLKLCDEILQEEIVPENEDEGY